MRSVEDLSSCDPRLGSYYLKLSCLPTLSLERGKVLTFA